MKTNAFCAHMTEMNAFTGPKGWKRTRFVPLWLKWMHLLNLRGENDRVFCPYESFEYVYRPLGVKTNAFSAHLSHLNTFTEFWERKRRRFLPIWLKWMHLLTFRCEKRTRFLPIRVIWIRLLPLRGENERVFCQYESFEYVYWILGVKTNAFSSHMTEMNAFTDP